MNMLTKKILTFFLSIIIYNNVFAICGAKFEFYNTLSKHCDVTLFINKMVSEYHFDADKLANLIDSANVSYDTLEKFDRRYIKSSYNYLALKSQNTKDADEIYEQKIDDGIKYWQQHKKVLAFAKRKYHVPPEIIVAIIGMETSYGQAKLNYIALDTLITLSFYNSIRNEYFTSELAQLLLLARDLKVNPQSIYSSYDGGLGLPQFMPSSYRKYGVAYNKHKKPNLMRNDDAIVSIANYLFSHGWKPQEKNLDVLASYNSNPNYLSYVTDLSQDIKQEYHAHSGRPH